jgi:pimeloyl-ACP methyl ester carboxylesterase
MHGATSEIPGVPLRHVRIDTNGLRLHVAIAGEGPAVLLLHGFPEHWWSWRRQMPALARAGFSAWAVDLRGYHLSDRPLERDAYRLAALVGDIAGVVRATGQARCDVVGHDWGGIIAWAFAVEHPELLRRLVVLNAPHRALFAREVHRPRQMLRSAYVPFFAIPAISEAVLSARDFALVRAIFTRTAARAGAYSAADIDTFVDALRPPGALTAALNYYRANLRRSVFRGSAARTIAADTLVLWGERDPALDRRLLDGLEQVVPRLRVLRFPHASHWVHADEPERVNDALVSFLR